MVNKQVSNLFQAPQTAIASYDWTDIAEGTGVIIFDGFAKSGDSTGNITYGLTNNIVYGAEKETKSDEIIQNGYTIEKTLNFALTAFNLPRTIKGKALIEGTWQLEKTNTTTTNAYIVWTIQKYDGTNYTTIGTFTTETITSAVVGTTIKTFSVEVNLTETHFKKGEILNIKAEMTGKGSGSAGEAWIYLAHDPVNSDNTWATAADNHTDLKFYIPFRIDT
jgi:hypothetical protein